MSKSIKLTINVDEDKLKALTHYLAKKDALPEMELEEYFEKLFEKHVPKELREYLEIIGGDQPKQPVITQKPEKKPAGEPHSQHHSKNESVPN